MNAFQRAWRGGRSDWRLHLLSVFSVSVAFVCLASALLVVVNVEQLHSRWATLGRASVYLVPKTPREGALEIQRALEKTAGVRRVRYVSSTEARHDLEERGGDTLLQELPDAAFPASLEVDFGQNTPRLRVDAIKAQLESLPSVENVETYGDWTERLGKVLAGGVTAAVLLAVVVLASVISVVSSTIRLALQRRQREVEILKLVGATDPYVRRPFLIEGAAQGVFGAILALVLVAVLYAIIHGQFDAELGALLGMRPRFLPLWLTTLLVAAGGGLGVLAAFASLRKLLTV
jgi:cell division transport system permease protein